jgi:hypothetical protein
VDAGQDGLKLLDKVKTGGAAHTLAIDVATGNVWVAYSDATSSYVQCLKYAASQASE